MGKGVGIVKIIELRVVQVVVLKRVLQPLSLLSQVLVIVRVVASEGASHIPIIVGVVVRVPSKVAAWEVNSPHSWGRSVLIRVLKHIVQPHA